MFVIRVASGHHQRGCQRCYHPLNAPAEAICTIANKRSLSLENLSELHKVGAVVVIMERPFGQSLEGRCMKSFDGRPLPPEAFEVGDPPQSADQLTS